MLIERIHIFTYYALYFACYYHKVDFVLINVYHVGKKERNRRNAKRETHRKTRENTLFVSSKYEHIFTIIKAFPV